jgi:hypothetical protein
MKKSLGFSAGLALLFSVLPVSNAHAAPPVCQKYDEYGICLILAGGGAKDSGNGNGHSVGGTGGSGVGNANAVSRPKGGRSSSVEPITVDGQLCTPGGKSSPQPPQSAPVWSGHTTGAIYDCFVAPRVGRGFVIAGMTLQRWAATAPAPAAPSPPDPRVLAQQAIESMRLKAITIGIVPESRAGSIGIVGMPTWMWVQNPNQSTWGPITRSASAGGFTVSATADVDRVVWAMGDGSTVACTVTGTAYQDSFGKKSSPTCGHTYTRQGTYTVRATSYWTVQWSGVGESGTIPLNFTQITNITMGEAQVLTQ